jgi:hypothetical protein
MTMARTCRWAAIAIAVAGVVDPAVTTIARVRPDVAVVRSGAPELAADVAASLDDRFRVIRGPYRSASATISVGTGVPDEAAALPAPVFAVVPAATSWRITGVEAPDLGQVRSRIPVVVHVAAPAGGGTADVVLRVNGGVVDRASVTLDPASLTGRAALSFLPLGEGPSVVRAELAGAGDAAPVAADVLIDVRDTPWRVLFHDARPSWMSTFIRRVAESDVRFDPVARVITSRGVSMEVGRSPASLARLDDLRAFDAVVVGAPEALTAADVAGLEAFARQRGGTVVLALDRRAPGTYERLLGVEQWRGLASPGAVAVRAIETGLPADSLPATELAWPAVLPPAASVLATWTSATGTAAPVIWSLPLGSGQVVVNGALDAWRYRAADDSAFDGFWRLALARAAARAPRAISLEPGARLIAPGDTTTFAVWLRDIALEGPGAGDVSAEVTAYLEGPGGVVPLRAWPDGAPGRLRVDVTAPASAGSYRLVLLSGDDRTDAAVVVSDDLARPAPDQRALLEAWAAARGGEVLDAGQLAGLAEALDAAVPPRRAASAWRPLRAAWWSIPFALLLGVEWWWRRRNGLA